MTRTSSSDHARRRGTSPRRRAAARVTTVVGGGLLAGLAAVAGASVAHAADTSADVTSATTVAVVVRLVLLVAGALVAGLGLVAAVPGLSGATGRPARRTAWAAGLVAAGAALVDFLAGEVDVTGTLVWVVLAVAVPVVLASSRPAWAALPGLGALVLVVLTLGSGQSGLAFAADAVYVLALALLLGAVVTVAAGGLAVDPDSVGAVAVDAEASGADPAVGSAAAPRRPGRLAVVVVGIVVVGIVAVLAGVARVLIGGPFTIADLTGTAYGLAALAAVVLPALAVAAVVVVTRRRSPQTSDAGADAAPAESGAAGMRRPVVGTAAALTAALAVGAAAVAGLLPTPAPQAEPGRALLRTVALDGQDVPLLVTPMRPGRNLVQLGGSGYPQPGAAPAPSATGSSDMGSHDMSDHDMSGMSGHDMGAHVGGATVDATGTPVAFSARPGARGGWAVVDIPAGTGSVTVSMAGDSATVPVDVGTGPAPGSNAAAGPDGPECASAVVGAVLAGGPGAGTTDACPSQALDPEQARDLRATLRSIAERGATTVRVASDASPRSVAAARLVREEGARAGLTFPPDAGNDPNSALVVVSGWEQAVTALREADARSRSTPTHLGGTFLAPWLLTGDVVRNTAAAFVPLPFTPNGPAAQRFAVALAATYPDTGASTSGFLAYARAAGQALDPVPTLYGAAAVDVPMSVEPPGSTGHHGGPDPASWYPGGTVVPVGHPLDTAVAP